MKLDLSVSLQNVKVTLMLFQYPRQPIPLEQAVSKSTRMLKKIVLVSIRTEKVSVQVQISLIFKRILTTQLCLLHTMTRSPPCLLLI